MELSLDDYFIQCCKTKSPLNVYEETEKTSDWSFKGERRTNDENDEDYEIVVDCYDEDYLMEDAEKIEEPKIQPKPTELLAKEQKFDNPQITVSNNKDEQSDWRQPNVGKPPIPIKSHDLRALIEQNSAAHIGRDKVMPGGTLPASSPQYRIMNPNVISQRPAGMPALVPPDAINQARRFNRLYQNGNNGNNGGKNYGNNGHKNRNNWGRGQRNNNYNRNNNNNNNNNNNHDNTNNSPNNNGWNNGRKIQRNNQKSNQNNLKRTINNEINNGMESKGLNMKIQVNHNKGRSIVGGNDANTSKPIDFFGITSEDVGSGSASKLTPAAANLLGMRNSLDIALLPEMNETRTVNSLLGLGHNNVTAEMIPMIASKFLDLIGNHAPVHKPIYDWKIQKEIHELQQKPMQYRSGGDGASVISSDGPGIEMNISPHSASVSLNCRFS